MNPVDHVRYLSNLEPARDPLIKCLSAPRWWKSPTYRKSFNDITVCCTRPKGRSHRRSENWPTARYSKDQGLAGKLGCFGKFMAWLCFLICDSFFDSHTAPGRGGVKSFFEPIDLTLTTDISHQSIDSFMQNTNSSLIPIQCHSILPAIIVLAVLVRLQSSQKGQSLRVLSKNVKEIYVTFKDSLVISPLTAVRF